MAGVADGPTPAHRTRDVYSVGFFGALYRRAPVPWRPSGVRAVVGDPACLSLA
ncbi:hypothetical protein SSCG_05944 [Streptomyces clavuligerus]|nr:hypothetical protein SSCG_05944 [Streptomyces clavuligerus]